MRIRNATYPGLVALFEFDGDKAPTLKLLRNPDVTVRSRGVMEKCTYCVQRINGAKIEAQKQDRPVRDGEIKTACQQACPVQAIVFGNIRDGKSAVAQLKQSPLNYSLLGELNTLPRTTHLARIRNPHPDLEGPATNDTRPVGSGSINASMKERSTSFPRSAWERRVRSSASRIGKSTGEYLILWTSLQTSGSGGTHSKQSFGGCVPKQSLGTRVWERGI